MRYPLKSPIKLDDPSVNGIVRAKYGKNTLTLEYPCIGSTDCSPYVVQLKKGKYTFEVWGAQGGGINTGYPSNYEGGKGGYSIGKCILNKSETFYIYVGSSGLKSTGNGGYNGGGAVGANKWFQATTQTDSRSPGGGATDIRFKKGTLISLRSVNFYTKYYGPESSLKSRIIVAGGGGGNNGITGYGGGKNGALEHFEAETATSGSQTSPGTTFRGTNAGFGYGGYTTSSIQGISGGGGGYYGGGGASKALCGSGYVDTKYFYFSQTIAGNQMFPSPSGSQKTGHSGDGCVRITFFLSSNTYLFIRNRIIILLFTVPCLNKFFVIRSGFH